MKVLLWVLLLFAASARGQTQALKQLELDIQKLAQLKAMLNSMYSGYSVLSSGYKNIKRQSLASFNLHKSFIDGLSMVSPAVKNAPAIFSILSIQSQIAEEYQKTLATVKSSGVFTVKEIDELRDAYSKIMQHSSRNMDALQLVITAGKLQMTEAQRLEMLESLGQDMEKQLLHLRNFTTQATQISLLRARIKKDNQLLRNSYGIFK